MSVNRSYIQKIVTILQAIDRRQLVQRRHPQRDQPACDWPSWVIEKFCFMNAEPIEANLDVSSAKVKPVCNSRTVLRSSSSVETSSTWFAFAGLNFSKLESECLIFTHAGSISRHSAYSAIVEGIVSLGMKERELQDPGREYDFIVYRVIVRVYRRWRHSKSRFVYWFAQLAYHILV